MSKRTSDATGSYNENSHGTILSHNSINFDR